MFKHIVKQTTSYPISIFIAIQKPLYKDDATPLSLAKRVCQNYCDEVGLCITVTETNFVYTDGEEPGIIVGFINYPRFPKNSEDILTQAYTLTFRLIDELNQQSASIQTPEITYWISRREEDLAED